MFNERFPNPDDSQMSGYRGRGPRGGHGGRGGHGFGPGPGGPRGRHRRGGLRIALLTLLSENSPKTGSELIQMLAERGPGRRVPSPVVVYPALQLLEDDGLISGSTPDSGSGRGYELTDAGRAFLEQLGDRSLAGPGGIAWPGMSQERVDLRRSVIATIAAARQVGFTGKPETAARATELLDEARKSLYRLLAEDGPAAQPTEDGSTAEHAGGEVAGGDDGGGEPSGSDD